MRARMLGITSIMLFSAGLTGCKWVSPRSNFERDPLVMSHLSTSNKRSYGATETATPKGNYQTRYLDPRSGVERTSHDEAQSAEIKSIGWPDYKSITGRVHYRIGKNPGWYLHFVQRNVDDRFGNAVMLAESPKLGLLREGDLVRIQGDIVNLYPGDIRYRVDLVTVLSEQN